MSGNLNGQQFSQPTLPGFNIKPTAEHRWPRGFTPERLQEAKQAMPNSRILGQVYADKGPIEGAFVGHRNPDVDNPWMGRKEGEAKVQETVARSTVDLSKLAPVNVRTTAGKYEEEKDREEGSGGGWYRRNDQPLVYVRPYYSGTDIPTKQLTSKQAAGNRELRQSNEQTLLHELGHHESSTLGLPHSSEAAYHRSDAARGQEEAFADDYRSEHYRPDPRDERRGAFTPAGYDQGGKTPINPYNEHGDVQKQMAFADAYQAARVHPSPKTEPVHKMAEYQVGTYPSGVPKRRSDPDIEGQSRLFMRRAPEDETQNNPDYGQWPLYKSDPTGEFYRSGHPKTVEVDLPTHKLGRGVPEKYRR